MAITWFKKHFLDEAQRMAAMVLGLFAEVAPQMITRQYSVLEGPIVQTLEHATYALGATVGILIAHSSKSPNLSPVLFH